MKLVCIGDSLTFGYGVFKHECWFELVKKQLDNIEIINKGVNGDTTAGMLSRSYNDVIELGPSHVLIMGGCNDFMAGRSIEMVQNNLEELIKEAINYNIVPIVGIETPIDIELAKRKWCWDLDYSNITSIEESYRQWILNFCSENNILYIDFYKEFKDVLANKNPREIYVDGLHPTALGHEIMADLVVNKFRNEAIG